MPDGSGQPAPYTSVGDQNRLAERVLAGDRAAIAQAVTLVESSRDDHRAAAERLLAALLPHTGGAVRVGVTGAPGVGKSTFIDTLGRALLGQGHRVAVLAVDPSSVRSGGSILGDRTRMGRLAADTGAFVRPSPSAGTLGGVARATRETLLVMEAAGYDVVLVETVGVGQSEFLVAGMVDTVLLLTLARTGDSLQGMKRGILEVADVIAVNKADGPAEADSRHAARELIAALRLLRGDDGDWPARVLTCSGRDDVGVDAVWRAVEAHRAQLRINGALDTRRAEQSVDWMRSMVRDRLLARLDTQVARTARIEAEAAVRSSELTPAQAADHILSTLGAPTAVSGSLVMLSGLPGAGKSVLADGLRNALPAFVLSVDPVEDALYRVGIPRGEQAGLGAYVAVEALAEPALRAGQSVVIDAVNDDPRARAQWRDLAARAGADLHLIEVVCSDPVRHRAQLEGRRRGFAKLPEPTWASLGPRREALQAWSEPRLVIDSTYDQDTNLARARAYVRCGGDGGGTAPAAR
jgi:LAO/AO transport system kinase